MQMADEIVTLGLKDLGYEYVNTDDLWLQLERSPEGKLIPGKNFGGPGEEGMRNLSAYIHGKGLKFGVYGAAGETTCAKAAGNLYHERADAAQLASWGVDLFKYDECGENNLQSFAKFSVMRDALNATGRPIVFSYEPHITVPISWPPFVGNLWRTFSGQQSVIQQMYPESGANCGT